MDVALKQCMQKGFEYLQKAQQPNGSFISYSSQSQRPFRTTHEYHTTFVPSLILSALGNIPTAQPIRDKLAAWLLTQKNDDWAYNYWATDAPERTTKPYPDDLDDTFCALAALYKYDPSLIDGHALGKIVRLLLAAEKKVGGPYYTWLVSAQSAPIWRDVDLAVNSNIAYFLRLAAHPLRNLDTEIEAAIVSGDIISPYYPSAYPILYYMARGYSGQQKGLLAKQLYKRRKSGIWSTPLHTALAISSLASLDVQVDAKKVIQYLISSQQADGSWAAEAFCIDPARNGQRHYNGSPTLTTAFVLEALYSISSDDLHTSAHTPTYATDAGIELFNTIITTAKADCSSLDTTLQTQLISELERMAKGNHNKEIVLLPYFFAQALPSSKVSKSTLIRLGLANLYGWTAYSIYDDFLDGSGDARLLSAANVSLRQSLTHFKKAVPHSVSYTRTVTDIFNTIDGANAWEVMHCRFNVHHQKVDIGPLPKYGSLKRLAERSLGHALAPLGVLASIGMTMEHPGAKMLLSSLKHYLIARQLYDDLVDWEVDIRVGQCSYVVMELLSGIDVSEGTYSLDTLVEHMQQEYIEHCLSKIGSVMQQHLRLAKRELRQSKLFTEQNSVTQLLEDLMISISNKLTDHQSAQAFLRAYTGD